MQMNDIIHMIVGSPFSTKNRAVSYLDPYCRQTRRFNGERRSCLSLD